LKDITLLGQNVNSYSWQELASQSYGAINDIEGLYRLRFITSHPKDFSDELIEAMRDCDKICEHIHLPLQSGDTETLSRMNRGYSYEHYLSRVQKLRSAIPNVAITTDLIAGFPGETETQFEATLAAMREIEFDYAFCFKYSPRSGTQAADYQEQLPEATRLERLQRMIDLQRDITYRKFQNQIGKTVEVYVEDISKKSNEQLSGKTRDFKIAVLSGKESQIGSLIKAKVIDATAGTLICE
jgi:tRNA-2-methylthio-N6-dimethylallyladenosine synthase